MTKLITLAIVGCSVFSSCKSDDSGSDTKDPTTASQKPQATEWVGFHIESALAPQDFHAIAAGLFGEDAQAGTFVENRELSPGIFVSAGAETSTPDQTRLTFKMDDGKEERTLAVAPASFEVGKVFIAAVDAALAKMQADQVKEPGSGESFLIEYKVTSAQGGKLSFGVRGDRGEYSLVVDVTSPHTNLDPTKLNTPVEEFEPYDTVAGTVWFHMTQDDFDFFTNHAYGSGATSKQNFNDFALVPHTWLRLTVDPHLDDQYVSVGFEVLALDGTRVAVAKAPASLPAGGTFKALVLRNMRTMTEAEKAKPGSSRPFKVPFYYDNPDGGGVVQVIAQGEKGQFSVAYAIESPRHNLKDVEFVAFTPVVIEPPDPTANTTCDKLGDPSIVLAPKGSFEITFKASDVILNSSSLDKPLQGPIMCSMFYAKDVTITGPNEGAVEVQSFTVPAADLQSGTAPTFTTEEVYAGDYHILCAQDIDASGDVSKGDPVTLPIGGFTAACNRNPVTVEFAILNPQE